MSRPDAIAQIRASIESLPTVRLEALAELAGAWSRPTVFSSLTEAEKAEIEAALDALDRGERVSWAEMKAELDRKLKAVGA